MPKLIIGCGYLGLRVARRWLAEGETVYGTTRSTARAEALAREGVQPIVADVTQPATLRELPTADTVVYSVAFDPKAENSREAVYVAGLRAVLDRLGEDTRRVVLTSSTGVYGPSGGQWVDEDTPARPIREAGRVMLAAEATLQSHPLGQRAIVLRLAGLYGPQRIPKVADLLAGRPIVAFAGGFLNLVHVDDAAASVARGGAYDAAPRIFLVSDGYPVPRRDFYIYLADLLGCSPPQLVEPTAEELATLRGTTDKRVRNTRLIQELRVTLQYPSYREGLASVVRSRES